MGRVIVNQHMMTANCQQIFKDLRKDAVASTHGEYTIQELYCSMVNRKYIKSASKITAMASINEFVKDVFKYNRLVQVDEARITYHNAKQLLAVTVSDCSTLHEVMAWHGGGGPNNPAPWTFLLEYVDQLRATASKMDLVDHISQEGQPKVSSYDG